MADTIVLDGDISLTLTLDGDASLDNTLDGEFGVITKVNEGAYPVYTGATEVTPSATTAQILETANTSVMEDITVKVIPYYETSNKSGYTVYIGSEV